MAASYWLLKTEPSTYSFDQLMKDKRTNWNGVRNYQARNHLKKMAKGDFALIYHSGDEKAVVGVAKVVREAYADIDPEGGDWAQVDIEGGKKLKTPVSLSLIKQTKALSDLPLIKQSRLSVMPVTEMHYQLLLDLGGISGG
ncbi:MAG: EVE domain-containing protein [Bdellovibrionota bacterium]